MEGGFDKEIIVVKNCQCTNFILVCHFQFSCVSISIVVCPLQGPEAGHCARLLSSLVLVTQVGFKYGCSGWFWHNYIRSLPLRPQYIVDPKFPGLGGSALNPLNFCLNPL